MPVHRRQAAALLAAALMPLPAAGAVASTGGTARLPAPLARGFNLPGWVDEAEGIAPARPVLEKLRALGFSSIRLPVAGGPLLGDGEAARAMLRRIRDAVAFCVGTGFAVVLDLHPGGAFGESLERDAAEGGRNAVAAWRLLRDVVADFSDETVFAELLNEPPMEQEAWLALRDELAGVVRRTCPTHGIVWGPARYHGLWELADATPLADERQIVAVHYYSPMAFTHQCADWSGSALRRLSNLPFPATPDMPAVTKLRDSLAASGDEDASALLKDAFAQPWSATQIASEFDRAGAWARANNCPVVVGEFGVLDFCADPTSRATWVRAVREAAEANGFGWTYWELDQGFGFIDSRQATGGFDLSMVDALLGGGG
jgi:endoglucanase